METQNILAIVCYVFTITALFFVIVRSWVRVVLVKSFGWDDGLIVLAMVLSIILSAFTLASIHFGLGKHAVDLTERNLSLALKYQVVSQPIYILGTLFIRISVGILLLRIATTQGFRYFIIGSMIVMSIWTFIVVIVVLLQCQPLSLSWDPLLTPQARKAHCMNRHSFTDFGYAFSAMDIFFNWVLALLPIPMLKDLQMSIQVKISLLVVLGLGAFASTTTIIRFQYLVNEKNVEDFTFAIARSIIWTILEVNLGIAATCLATLRPLFKNFSIPGFSSGSRTRRRTTNPTANPRSYVLSQVGTKSNATGGTSTRKFVKLGDANASHNSQESIIDHDGIQKRVDVDVVYEP